MTYSRGESDKATLEPIDERQSIVPGKDFIAFERSEIEQTVSERFQQQAQLYPERVAVKTPHKTTTYAELDKVSGRLANVLSNLEADPRAPVALLTERNEKQAIGIFAVYKAGRTLIPMESMLTPERITGILNDSLARIIITDGDNLALAESVCPAEGIIINMDDIGQPTDLPHTLQPAGPESPALILYTSGTMGKPKGVMHTHRNLMHFAMCGTNFMAISRNDSLLQPHPINFIAGQGVILRTLLNGAALYPADIRDMGLALLKQWLVEEKITVFNLIPTVFRRLFGSLDEGHVFPDMRLTFLGGEPLERNDVDLFFKHAAPSAKLGNGLGSTETGWTARCFISKNDIEGNGIMPVGFPVEDKEVLLIDPNGKEVPQEETGEIVVHSRYISPGYWSQGVLHPEKLYSNLAGKEKKVYRTGDMGRFLSDGRLVVLGRNDSQIKVRGHKVNIVDVEAAVRSIHGVSEVMVLQKGNPYEKQNGNPLDNRHFQPHLTAYAVLNKEVDYSTGDMRTRLLETVPEYMVPANFIFLESMPTNSNGKIDRSALLRIEKNLSRAHPERVEPRDELEHEILRIWEKVLGRSPIKPEDNFFDLGGDSLAAISICEEVGKLSGKNIPQITLLQASTVRAMRQLLRDSTKAPADVFSVVPVQAKGHRPPFILIPGILGDGFGFRILGGYLNKSQPLYSINIGGKNLNGNSRITIKDLAEELVRSIISFQPEGPYYLGGFSYGGYLAWEIACQLEKANRRVAALVIVDTNLAGISDLYANRNKPMGTRIRNRFYKEYHELKRLLITLAHYRGALNKIAYTFHWLKAQCRRLLHLGSADLWTLLSDEQKKIRDEYIDALHHFEPQRYHGQVALIRGSIQHTREAYTDKSLGWRDFAKGEMEIHEVPGHHIDLLREPFVRHTADILNNCLKKAQSETSQTA